MSGTEGTVDEQGIGPRADTSADASGRLGTEVRQSLSLIGMTALTLAASIAFGLFVGHIG
jgi:hypothetical protein